MATYKVIQDIEAEDKLIGPLTLRQFVYAAIVVVSGFIAFKLSSINPLFVLPFLPIMGFFGLLAAPFGHDQSSEVWLLAKIRFFLKPRRRIWDQTGIEELVTITVPKRAEHQLTNGLSQTEVRSRLKALANTLDSRGWAIKNVNVNLFSQPSYLVNEDDGSDRLVNVSNLPQDVPSYDIQAADDILDETNNPTAQHLNAMISQAEQTHHQTMVAKAHGQPSSTNQGDGPAPITNWQMPTPSSGTITTNDEQALLHKIHHDKSRDDLGYQHMKKLQPVHHSKTKRPKTSSSSDAMTTPANPDILRLASNDDLNISTIAREANKHKTPPDDEVVIPLR